MVIDHILYTKRQIKCALFQKKKRQSGEEVEKLEMDPGEVRERSCGEYDQNTLYGYMKSQIIY